MVADAQSCETVSPDVEAVITAAQCRMARVGLGLSQDELAEAANINRQAVLRFERRDSILRGNNMDALQQALERRGATFGTFPDGRPWVAIDEKRLVAE